MNPSAILAPTGSLRMGLYSGSPTSYLPAQDDGEPRGVGFELGRAFASRLGVPFAPVVLPSNARVNEAAKAAAVDLVFTNATAERAHFLDFTDPVLAIEKGYLVGRGSPLADAPDVDAPGVRVGAAEASTTAGELRALFRHAAVLPVASLQEAASRLLRHDLDAFATNKAVLFEMADAMPGARVLAGRWGLERFALGVPKGREDAVPYLRAFVAQARAEGLVNAALARAGVRGAGG